MNSASADWYKNVFGPKKRNQNTSRITQRKTSSYERSFNGHTSCRLCLEAFGIISLEIVAKGNTASVIQLFIIFFDEAAPSLSSIYFGQLFGLIFPIFGRFGQLLLRRASYILSHWRTFVCYCFNFCFCRIVQLCEGLDQVVQHDRALGWGVYRRADLGQASQEREDRIPLGLERWSRCLLRACSICQECQKP